MSSSADHQEDKLFSLCLTRDSDKVYVNTNKSKEDAICSEALVATKCKEWSGFFHIATLSTVLARPIFSAYADCQTWIRDFLHSEICPREIQNLEPLEPLFVLWSRDGNLDNRSGAWYSPNHFVPLYSTGKRSNSSAKENDPEKHQQETVTVKPANQRKRPLNLDGKVVDLCVNGLKERFGLLMNTPSSSTKQTLYGPSDVVQDLLVFNVDS